MNEYVRNEYERFLKVCGVETPCKRCLSLEREIKAIIAENKRQQAELAGWRTIFKERDM